MSTKKSRAQKVQDSFDQSAQTIEKTGQEVQKGLTDLGKAYMQGLNDAAKAQSEGYNLAQQQYQQRINAGYTQFADIIAGEKARADAAEQEAIDQRKAEQNAARWTGATELAASLANLIAVGGYKASNQQYKSYSQDWMKQAEANWQANRARFDNLRDRQRALQQQLIQLKMNDAGQMLNFGTKMADAAYQHGAAAAEAAYKTSSAPLNVQLSTADKAATLRTQGAVHAAAAEHQQASEAQGWAGLKERQRQFNIGLRMQGRDSEGAYNQEYVDEIKIIQAEGLGTSSKGGGSDGKASGDVYAVTIDGKPTTLRMSKETYGQGIQSGTEELKKDVVDRIVKEMRAKGLKISGEQSWENIVRLTKMKKVRQKKGDKVEEVDNPLYGKEQDIITALNNFSGDSEGFGNDYEVIERYVKDNKSSVNNFNKHLKRLSNSSRTNGERATEAAEAAEASAPSQKKRTWEDDLFGN